MVKEVINQVGAPLPWKKGKSRVKENRVVTGFGKAVIVIILLLVIIAVSLFKIFDTCPWAFKGVLEISSSKFMFQLYTRAYFKGQSKYVP